MSTPGMDINVDDVLSPLVCCGPSGVGKGTLIWKLLSEFSDTLGFSVSHTTRKPRPGEIHGEHYYFSSKDQMELEIAEGHFIEHASVHGNTYGTSFKEIQRVHLQGRVCVLDIDTQGVKQIKSKQDRRLKPNFVFIAPPSMEELEHRLRGRGTEAEEVIKVRLENAKDEVEYGLRSGSFDRVIVNDELCRAYTELVLQVKEWYPSLVERLPSSIS